MSRTARRSAGLALAATAAIGLVGTGAGTALGGTAHPALAKTPKISVTVSGKHMKVSGPTKIRSGRIALVAKGGAKGGGVEIGSFAKHYSYKKFRNDIATYGNSFGQNGPSKAGLKAINRAIAHVSVQIGLDPASSQTVSGTTVLKAGHYVLWNDSGDIPAQPHKLVVKGKVAKRATPNTTATAKAASPNRFAGDKTLPAKGTITFKNTSHGKTASPHMLSLQHVQDGTTKQDLQTYFSSGSQDPPSWALPESASTDIITAGQTMTFSYDLPAGSYVELCFFPDPKTGMPHAYMGMYRLITLK